ncbi:MAG: aminotransferase class V-fold PLP-dependent enzyme [Candidatus Paceibacteria bacterium]
MQDIKQKFPVFKQNQDLIYLDNAATTQMPKRVIEVLNQYYNNKSNVHRGFYPLAQQATKAFEEAREKVAEFISSEPKEIIFNSGTTEGMNNLARMLEPELSADDNIVITIVEHHANFVPWQQLSDRVGCELRVIELDDECEFGLQVEGKIDEDTKVVSFSYISNALGFELPVKNIVDVANKVSAYTIIDSAQAMTSKKINVKDLNIDFLAFSGHKLFGPTGIGVLYGRKALLQDLDPSKYGGEMIRKVTKQSSSWTDIPHKYEAGTPNVTAAIGLGEALDFITDLGIKKIASYKQELTNYLIDQLNMLDEVVLLSPENKSLDSGIVSFQVEGVHAHDVADLLASENICVRAGHHCAMPLMGEFDVSATVRVSISIYNNKKDIDQLIDELQNIIQLFNK